MVTFFTQTTTRKGETVVEEDRLEAGMMEDMAEEVETTNQGTTGVASRGNQDGLAGLATMTMTQVAMADRKVGPKVRDQTSQLERVRRTMPKR